MENLLILGLGQEVYKMNLEHLVMPERKKKGGVKNSIMAGLIKEHQM